MNWDTSGVVLTLVDDMLRAVVRSKWREARVLEKAKDVDLENRPRKAAAVVVEASLITNRRA